MLLVIDIGNTNITLGAFRGEELLGTFRMMTKLPRTSDEYGIMLKELVERQGILDTDIDAAIVASVVPDIMHSFGSAMIKYFGIQPIIVSAGGDIETGTTYDVVGADGTFDAAVIAPGISTSAQAMWGQAAMLPAVEIRKPESILGRETVASMQAGIVYGQIGQTEYIVEKIRAESGYENAKVVASGGLGKMIAQETDVIDVYDPQLTLKGLRIIYEKNKNNINNKDNKEY